MLSLKETKNLTELINKVINYVNTLESRKQKLALKVINDKIYEMLQSLLEVGK